MHSLPNVSKVKVVKISYRKQMFFDFWKWTLTTKNRLYVESFFFHFLTTGWNNRDEFYIPLCFGIQNIKQVTIGRAIKYGAPLHFNTIFHLAIVQNQSSHNRAVKKLIRSEPFSIDFVLGPKHVDFLNFSKSLRPVDWTQRNKKHRRIDIRHPTLHRYTRRWVYLKSSWVLLKSTQM